MPTFGIFKITQTVAKKRAENAPETSLPTFLHNQVDQALKALDSGNEQECRAALSRIRTFANTVMAEDR